MRGDIEMKLENQVVSLELAKQLKELGVKQESLFYWTEFFGGTFEIKHQSFASGGQTGNCAAFTVAELGEMLSWQKLYIFNLPDELKDLVRHGETEADARAKMLVYLLENKFLTNYYERK